MNKKFPDQDRKIGMYHPLLAMYNYNKEEQS